MIANLIRWSLQNRLLILLLSLLLAAWGVHSLRQTPVDAIPDLSDVQVIIKTSYPGQAPRVVESQVTYPITTAMLAVPGATAVRGFYFGDSYIYVLFEDGTNLYWARSRVLEYLSQISAQLPDGVQPTLGPDATGVGWVYQYALVDRTGRHDLSELRSIQDWFLRYELQTVPGVAEVATVGGMVRQYQVVLDPNKLRIYEIPVSRVKQAIQDSNREIGGSVIERAEAEHMVYATGYIQGIDDLEEVPLGLSSQGTPIMLKDVAHIRVGPQMRRGIAELDGEGEVVGGIIVMRSGENVDRARGGQSQSPAGGRIHRRDPGVHAVPVSPALLAGDYPQPAAGHPGGFRDHAVAGHQRQHHVAGRHRDRDRQHGRCGHRDDRERAQARRARTAH